MGISMEDRLTNLAFSSLNRLNKNVLLGSGFPQKESRLLELKTWLSYYYSMNKSLLSFAFSFYWGGSLLKKKKKNTHEMRTTTKPTTTKKK